MEQGGEKRRKINRDDGRGAILRGRVKRYGPLLLWILFIFFASTGSFAAPKTSRILLPLLRWLFPDISEAAQSTAHLLVRKGAHVAEYAVLALLASRAFVTSSQEVLRGRWYAFAFGLVCLCSLLDEYHQSFVATRTGTIYDSMIDIAGGSAAILICALWRATREEGASV